MVLCIEVLWVEKKDMRIRPGRREIIEYLLLDKESQGPLVAPSSSPGFLKLLQLHYKITGRMHNHFDINGFQDSDNFYNELCAFLEEHKVFINPIKFGAKIVIANHCYAYNIEIRDGSMSMVFFYTKGKEKFDSLCDMLCISQRVGARILRQFSHIMVGVIPTKFQKDELSCGLFSNDFLKFCNSCPDLHSELLFSQVLKKDYWDEVIGKMRLKWLKPKSFMQNTDNFRMYKTIQSISFFEDEKNMFLGQTIRQHISDKMKTNERPFPRKKDVESKLYEQNLTIEYKRDRYEMHASKSMKSIEELKNPLISKKDFREFIGQCNIIFVNICNINYLLRTYLEANQDKKQKRWNKLVIYLSRLMNVPQDFREVDKVIRQKLQSKNEFISIYLRAQKKAGLENRLKEIKISDMINLFFS